MITDWKLALFIALLAISSQLLGQPLEVNNAPPITPGNLITNIFLGDGVEVLDVQFQGSAASVGFFQNGEDEIGLGRGIVMSTGYAASAPGRVGVDASGSMLSNEIVSGLASDPDMEALSGSSNINDLVAYTITFIPISDTLSFRYAFASEEYPEYVCSDFNDVFGFFISGPGINGPYSNNAENIALIPNTSLPVAINNVNPGLVGTNGDAVNCIPPEGTLAFSQYYNSNTGSASRPVFDGITDVFTAETAVYPCSTYTIKLVICDVADEFFDSGVFLEAKSFGTGSLNVKTATVSLDGSVAEGCTAGELVFSLPAPAESDYAIDYSILGTAQNGVDYQFIPAGLFIPAGDSVLSIPIIAFDDGLAEGTEAIVIDVQRDPCNRDTLIIPIKENVLLEPELRPDTSLCRGDSVRLDGTVDVPLPSPLTFYNEDTLVISPSNLTLYSDIDVFGVLPATLGPGVIRSVCIEDLQTTWADDLRIFLIAPGGQFMELVTDIGNAGDNFIGTCFTPTAAVPITSLSAADQPFTGEFAPEGLWEDLYGENNPTNGTWRLAVLDKFLADTPVLNRWSITFTPLYEINYEWQPTAGLSCADCPDPVARPDTAATYVVTATDSYGCESYDTVALEILPALDAPQLACAAVTGSSITVAWPGVPGATGYEVNVDSAGWEPASGANEHTVNGLFLATTVNVEVRATGPCSSLIASIACSTPGCAPPAAQVVSTSDVSCFGGADGSLTLAASDGTAPYQYVLDGQSNATGTFAGLPAGTYLAQAIDATGCPASLQVTINQPDSVIGVAATQAPTCYGSADGSAAFEISGGNPPFSFSWNNGQTDSIAAGLAAGTYLTEVSDAAGCAYSFQLTLQEPDPVEVEIATDSVRCFGGSIGGRAVVTATGGTGMYTYAFPPGTLIGTTPNQAVALSQGIYGVTITDTNGCEASDSFAIYEPEALQLQLSIEDVLCANGTNGGASVLVSGGTGAYAYYWQDALGDTLGTAPGISGLAAGSYILDVADAYGCWTSDIFTISAPPPIGYMLDVQPATCPNSADGAASLEVSGGTAGYAYNWSDIGPGPAVRNGLPAGNYFVTVTDLNSCSVEIPVAIESPPPIVLDFATMPVSCPGSADGQATALPSGGGGNYSYSWATGQNTAIAGGLPAGPVSVTVTDGNGCQATAVTEVGEASPLLLELEGEGPACFDGNDGTATATVQGGAGNYSYQWSNGQSGPTASGLPSGAHRVTVTDGNGCTAVGSVLLEEPAVLTNFITTQPASCNPEPDGLATANAQGGTPPYRYSWSDGQSQANAQSLAMGVYTLTLTDANGCALTDTVEVDGIPFISLSLESRDVSCNGGADGVVSVNAQGGSGNYSYNWSAGVSSGLQASGLSAGSYSVTVADELGCESVASVMVEEPSALSLEAVVGRVSCSGERDGRISLFVAGGASPYSILWNTGDTTLAIEELGVGAYSATVTDANGCRVSRADEVVEASPIGVSIEIEDADCYGEPTGAVRVEASGGLPPFAYRWPGGETAPALEGIPAGSYALSITDAAGCEIVEEIVVGQPSGPLEAAVTPVDVSCFGKKDGRIEIAGSGGTPFYRYSLDGDFFSGNNAFIGLAPGSYNVYIQDINGCAFRAGAVTVGEPQPILVNLGETRAAGFGEAIRLQPEVTGGVGALAYYWEPLDSSLLSCFDCSTPLVTVTGQASIKAIVTDEKGCTGEDIVTVYPQKDRPVFVPTGFTPNGDGSNDRLLVHAKEDIEILVLFFRVYDRWGELLFEANGFEPNDENYGWDGAYRGQPAQGGVYIWHVGVEFVDGNREEVRGNSTLVR